LRSRLRRLTLCYYRAVTFWGSAISYLTHQGYRALGLPLELRQTLANRHPAALTKRESANVFTQPNSALVIAARCPFASLPRSKSCEWRLASSSTLALSWCELRWWFRGATFEVCNSESFRKLRSASLGEFASRAMSFVAVEVGAAIGAGETEEQPPRPTFRR
jgi:hypothetical protein